MLSAAREVRQFGSGRVRADLDSDSMLARAIVHALQEIGEAATKVSQDHRARIPTVPWTKIVGTRHRLVHVYWGVNLDLVWEVVIRDIPALIAALELGTRDWPLGSD